jgi:hypothetical protein
VALALSSANNLFASFITVENVTGDTSSLHLELNMVWTAADVRGSPNHFFVDSADGTWTGGNWQFTYLVGETRLNEDVIEGMAGFLLQTVWDDGWTPLGLLSVHSFLSGVGASFDFSLFQPIVDRPITSNGVTYFFSGNHTGHMTAYPDTSGNAQIVFDLSRQPVPEGSTVALLSVGLFLLVLARLLPCGRTFRRLNS